MDEPHIVKMVADVPVEGGAPDVFCGLGVVVDRLRALIQDSAVVVPDHELHARQAGAGERGAEVFAHERAFLITGEQAGFPRLGGHRFVLHGQAPNLDPFLLIGADEAAIVVGPSLGIFGPEFAALQHDAIALHPFGWTPGGGEQLEWLGRRRPRRQDEGNAKPLVVID